jgi:hypothetical protein
VGNKYYLLPGGQQIDISSLAFYSVTAMEKKGEKFSVPRESENLITEL